MRELLARQGYTRFLEGNAAPGTAAADAGRQPRPGPAASVAGLARSAVRLAVTLEVVQDRLRAGGAERGRVLESLEAALAVGRGRVNVHVVDEAEPPQLLATWRYSSELHCPHCDLSYHEPAPSAFSFNSPLGACDTCRGFGRTIGIDYGLVIPDESKSLRGGAIKPWQSKSYAECQQDLEKFANGAAFRSTRRGASSRPRRATG